MEVMGREGVEGKVSPHDHEEGTRSGSVCPPHSASLHAWADPNGSPSCIILVMQKFVLTMGTGNKFPGHHGCPVLPAAGWS